MARKSILVVDDEKSQREILEMILSGEGYDASHRKTDLLKSKSPTKALEFRKRI